MKITITGASGFVGTNLSIYLKDKHHSIDALSLRGNWLTNFNPTVDAIIHLAGKAHDTKNTSDAQDYFNINTELTKEVFQKFLQSEIQDFFYFSSVKAVADTVEGLLTEEAQPQPITPYGKSKIEAEKYLLQQNLPAGKRLFIIRPCMIHGPGNKGNLNLLYEVVEKGIPWPLAAFENKRAFLSIDNLSFLILKMIQNKDLSSGIYNFADDQSVSTNNLVTIISDVLGKKAKLLKIPKSLFSSIAKIGDVTKLPLNTERLQKLTENYEVSNQKIKSALGIQHLPLTAEQGLRKTIESFKQK
ncbi:NAD-dependent epimerase/dehydratase family protein [Elizabethkingia sp. JS20170427COW]|uniref:NAD-dependent epimerase/dehydratase family protein n=1 Tax=Elizabethkingia sp. JS20170427COW TaxID=2583851 RepID=UPI001110375B|nr:NAD-dependent epimerase/dehydratase family protein [Elizabethkingia sp. JS20170427COW]QCX53681.1 NAD-dependent epimerase/dehydratase family protein [Elizabethkingia sp. JS20170427COW]